MTAVTTEKLWSDFAAGLWRFARARVASDADADDVVQDVFEKVHTRSGQLRDDERLAGWIYRIASNAVTDHHRARARWAGRPRPAQMSTTEPDPLEVDQEQLLALCVRPFVEQLPEHYRDALVMTEIEGMTQAEAAERAGISLSGMKSRVQRGRQKLRDDLEACCDVELDGRNRVMAVEAKCDGYTCAVGQE